MGEKGRVGRLQYQVVVKALGEPRSEDGRLSHVTNFHIHDMNPEIVRKGFEETDPEPGEYILIGHTGSVVSTVLKVTVRVPTVVVEVS